MAEAPANSRRCIVSSESESGDAEITNGFFS
jgi:hypothetical protein